MTDGPKGPQAAPIWAKSAPIFSNYFTISATPAIVRISFGEAFGSPESAIFHAAVALVPQDAEALAQSILDTIKKDREFRAAIASKENT
jgi:hypothetical protein